METTSSDEFNPNTPQKEVLQERIVPWYRFALLLTGEPISAAEVVSTTWIGIVDRLAQLRSSEGQTALLSRKILEASYAWRNTVSTVASGNSELAEGHSAAEVKSNESIWAGVAMLPEPSRSAYALFLAVDAPVSEMAEWLKLKDEAFAEALSRARRILLGDGGHHGLVGEFPTQPLLKCHRLWGKESPEVAKAVKAAAKDAKQQAALTFQAEVDRRFYSEIKQVELPAGFALSPLMEAAKPRLRSILRQPAVLSIGLALLVVLGVVVYSAVRKIDDFPGKETVMDMIDETDAMTGTELEAIAPIEAEKLQDWFLLKGFEGFTLPPELAKAKIVGGRVFKRKGQPVAQLAMDLNNALLLVFPLADEKLTFNSPSWQIFQQGEWAVAARGDGVSCYIVSFIGDSEEMIGFLHTVGKQ